MKSPVAHWGASERRNNLDDLAADPAHPQAFPSTYPMDLMGRIRVKLCAEDGNLVAYGFGGQRVVLPAKSVGHVVTVSSFRTGRRVAHGRALLVLDRDDRILLRASGLWETNGEVKRVCRAAKVPGPSCSPTPRPSRGRARRPRGAPTPAGRCITRRRLAT